MAHYIHRSLDPEGEWMFSLTGHSARPGIVDDLFLILLACEWNPRRPAGTGSRLAGRAACRTGLRMQHRIRRAYFRKDLGSGGGMRPTRSQCGTHAATDSL
jgi:hypothetical protein